MTRLEMRNAIGTALLENPRETNHAVSSRLGCDHKTVGTVRRSLEARRLIPQYGPKSGSDREYSGRRRRTVAVENLAACDAGLQCVYFVLAEECGLVKIGWTDDLRGRLRSLASLNACRLRLLATVPGDKTAERSIHDRFARLRRHGEWFEATAELLAFVNGHVKQGPIYRRAPNFRGAPD